MLSGLFAGARTGLRVLGLVTAVSLCAPSGRAASPTPAGTPIVIGQTYSLPSKVLGGARRLAVYLPEHYADSGRAYPVLFLLDGGEHEDFHHITGLAQINAAYGAGQEVIVIGVEGVDRRHDLTSPSRVAEDLRLAPTSGGSAEYRRFLLEEVRPWAAEHYRTTGRAALMGESLAGLFTAETLLASPQSFDDYIIISPSLWWNAGALARRAADDLKSSGFSGRRVFIAFEKPSGSPSEMALQKSQQDAFAAAFESARPSGLDWRAMRTEETHTTIYHPAALQAFRAFFGAPQ